MSVQDAGSGTSHRFENSTTPKRNARAPGPVGPSHHVRRNRMTQFKIFGAAAIAVSVLASPVMAQQVYRDRGFAPAEIAAGVGGGAAGTAAAMAPEPLGAEE